MGEIFSLLPTKKITPPPHNLDGNVMGSGVRSGMGKVAAANDHHPAL